MTRPRLACPMVVLLVGILLLLPGEAEAYVDPGTGSMLFQALLTLLLGAGVAIAGVRQRLARWLGFRKGSGDQPAGSSDQPADRSDGDGRD